jgi:hypothetical protein
MCHSCDNAVFFPLIIFSQRAHRPAQRGLEAFFRRSTRGRVAMQVLDFLRTLSAQKRSMVT